MLLLCNCKARTCAVDAVGAAPEHHPVLPEPNELVLLQLKKAAVADRHRVDPTVATGKLFSYNLGFGESAIATAVLAAAQHPTAATRKDGHLRTLVRAPKEDRVSVQSLRGRI